MSVSWVRLASMIAVFCSLRSIVFSTFHNIPRGTAYRDGEVPRNEVLGLLSHIRVLSQHITEIFTCKEKNELFSGNLYNF